MPIAPLKRIVSIVAVDAAGGIGYQGGLPWPASAVDKMYWKSLARTCDELVIGSQMALARKPKHGVPNWTISRNPDARKSLLQMGYRVAENLDCLLDGYQGTLGVLGGQWLYQHLIPLSHAVALTRIPGVWKADRHLLADPRDLPEFELEQQATVRDEDGDLSLEWWGRTGS